MMADVTFIAVQGGEQLARAAALGTAWILITGVLGVAAVAAGCAAWGLLARRRVPHLVILPPAGEVGDDTIAMLCRCCNGERGDDCICTHDCGSPRCEAACPAHAGGCGPGASLLAYPSLACPACDWIAERMEGGGDGD